MSPTWDVFVSYTPTDADAGFVLVDVLRERGLKVWHTTISTTSWPQLQHNLREGLGRCRSVVCLLSAACLRERETLWALSAVWGLAPASHVLLVGDPAAVPLPSLHARATVVEGEAPWEAVAEHLAALPAESPLLETLGVGLAVEVHGASASEPRPLVGREALTWGLWEGLEPVTAAAGAPIPFPPVVQVCGPSGIGKTAAVEEYVARFGRRYPGGVFWLRASTPGGQERPETVAMRLRRQLSAFAQQLGLRVAHIPADRLRARLGLALAERGLPCLWVVDALPDWLEDEALAMWLAPHPVARCVVTARRPWLDLSQHIIELDGLGMDDGLTLLLGQSACDDAGELEAARSLVTAVGGHPLALELLAGRVASSAEPLAWAAVKAELDAPGPEVAPFAGQLGELVPGRCVEALAATLLGAVGAARAEAPELAAMVQHMARAPLPYTLVTRAFELCRQPEREACQGSARLQLRSFAARRLGRPVANLQSLMVHRLVRRTLDALEPPSVGRETWEAPLAAATLELLTAGDAIGAVWTALDHAIEPSWSTSHSIALHRAASTVLADAEHLACAAETLRRAVRLALESYGPDHPTTTDVQQALATLLESHAHRDEVRALREAVLDATVRVRGEEHLETVGRMEALAGTLFQLGDLVAWRALERRVLRVRERVHGVLHPATMVAEDLLTERLLALGQAAEARERLEQTVDRRWENLGADAAPTLAATVLLAQAVAALGDLSHAHRLLETALETRRRHLGPDAPATLATMSLLADVMRDLGFLGGARSLLEQVLDARRRTLGPRHPDTLLASNNLAIMLWHLGDLPGARSIEEEVLDVRYHDLGPEHPLTLITMNNLAVTLRRQGEHARARVLLGHVLEVRRRDLGDQHPDTLAAMNNLAVTFWEEGDLEAAGTMEEQILKGRLWTLGEDHPDTLAIMSDLASTLAELGDLDGARELEAHVFETRLRDLGARAPETRASAGQLYGILSALGEREGASALVEEFGTTIEGLAPRPRGEMVRE